MTVSECRLMKLLPYISIEKYIDIYILALEMASPGNQHCANCIGTLSCPVCVYCLAGVEMREMPLWKAELTVNVISMKLLI